ncbi:MAG: DUF87 domain-containing protein [Clostridia bacterium]|nr:DUF87 domain-containing protein [Clostridia bacterium]
MAYLYTTGAAFEGGGIVGGVVGNLMYTGLKLPGSIVLSVVIIPLILMLLVGVTPTALFGKIRSAAKASKEKKAARRAERDDDDDDERDERVDRNRRKGAEAESRRDAKGKVKADEEEPEEAEETDEGEESSAKSARADKKSARKNRRTKLVDMDTGEVLEEDEECAALPFSDPEAKPSEKEEAQETAAEDRADTRKMGRKKTARSRDGELDWSDEIDEELAVLKGVEKDAPASREGARTADAGASDDARRQNSRDDYADDKDGEAYEGEMESVAADLEDEETATAAESASSVPYITNKAEGAEKSSSKDRTVVTILREDGSAVPERGLSEEELVLPTTFEDETPAEPDREYLFPSVDMLTRGSSRYEANDAEIATNTQLLREVLESFHIRVKEISCSCGPTITRFEVKPDTGVRVRSIANLVDDIAMNLAKAGVRIEAPIPGKAAVGIEVPNAEPATVYFRNILETPEFRNHKSRIAACLGADVSGRPVILDINKMPHLLIAGATGMGKSVCINSVIMSLLYKARPDEVKLVLIDPKKVEFAMYRELPHLLCPIVSDPKQAAGALYCAVNEMERRFGLIEEVGVRNLAGYNEITAGDPERPPLPQIVIIIDELADLMMTAPGDVETAICRLAQKARAAGIHLVIGTQRPSVDVITGLIKANIPSRIAFTVASAVDSRTIIDTVGADKLIGRGDMLYAPVGANKPMRCQGTFVSETEVERVVSFIKEHNAPVVYDEQFIKNIAVEAARCGVGKKKGDQMSDDDFNDLGGGQNLWGEEPVFWEALEVVVTKEKIGTSALQRALKLGYGRAAGLVDRLEEYGFVGRDPGNKTGRDVLITYEQLLDYKANGLPGHRKGDGGRDDEGDYGDFDEL